MAKKLELNDMMKIVEFMEREGWEFTLVNEEDGSELRVPMFDGTLILKSPAYWKYED